MSSVLPKLESGRSVQIQFKKPNQKCTISSLTSTLKKLIPNIKEIKITSKKLPKDICNKKLYIEPIIRPMNVRKGQKTQVKPNAKEKLDNKEVEYYPDKLKRKVDFKKIVLQPRHDYKVVAATNKRKRNTPMKDADSLKKPKTDVTSPEISTNELSFEDMIPSSIIHKIKNCKNTSLNQKMRPLTAVNLKNAPKTTIKGPITDPVFKNGPIIASDLKSGPVTASDLRSGPITAVDLKSGPKTASDLKNAPITASDSKIMPQKVKQRQKSNLKSDPNLKTPHKVLKSDLCPRAEELEDLMNDESLTDEDFMEILTCPSPVWWEDPPDANYIEEPIGSFSNQDNLPQNQDCTKIPSKTEKPKEITQNSLPELTIAKNSFGNKELIEKRLKLENLLSSLKKNCIGTDNTNKINNKVRKISSDGSELSVDGDDLVKSLQSIEIPIKNESNENIDKGNAIVHEKVDVQTDSDDVNEIFAAKTEVNKSNNHEITNKNEIKIDETVNKSINDETGIKNAVDDKHSPKSDTKSSTESNAALNSPSVEKKATSPRKSNRISPKKHQLTKYYNLKSKRPRIIKQNPRNKVIIENHVKTTINFQKTPEKKLNKKPNDVSKIKKAYLDLLQHSKIDNNLTPSPEKKEIVENTLNANTTEKTQENTITMETGKKQLTETTKQNHKTESADNNKSLSNENNNINIKNSKSRNEIPLILPKLTKIPQNLATESPKSIKSVTSDSTDANSEMDTISDTNVQFIDEYDEKKDELVTVYQIISKNEK